MIMKRYIPIFLKENSVYNEAEITDPEKLRALENSGEFQRLIETPDGYGLDSFEYVYYSVEDDMLNVVVKYHDDDELYDNVMPKTSNTKVSMGSDEGSRLLSILVANS